MPGCAVHFLLALEVWDRWPERPADRNAFLAGSIGPDMGYYPGGDPFLTDLCHYVRSADLARTLVRTARTDAERAFAWGWVTHVLGDAFGHPIVNRAAAELVLGDRQRTMTYHDDPIAHVRVEMGLDALFAAGSDSLGDVKLAPVFDSHSIGSSRTLTTRPTGFHSMPTAC